MAAVLTFLLAFISLTVAAFLGAQSAASDTSPLGALVPLALAGLLAAGGWRLTGRSILRPKKQDGYSNSDALDAFEAHCTLSIQDVADAAITSDASGTIDGLNEKAQMMLPASTRLGLPVAEVFREWHAKADSPDAADEIVQTLLDNPNLSFFDTIETTDGGLFERDSRPLKHRAGRIWTIRDLSHVANRAMEEQQQRALLEEDAARTAELAEQLYLAKAELEENQRKLEVLANTDGLTGLLNRRSFMAHGMRVIATDPDVISTLMLDIDFFKRINDTYGHACGDETIRRVAEIMREEAQSHGEAGRIGGEEFAILLRGLSPSDAVSLGERIRKRVAATVIEHLHQDIRVTVSIGIGYWTKGEETLDASLDRADKALYTAKEMGRNRLVLLEDQADTERAA